jgi:hypothetical protein
MEGCIPGERYRFYQTNNNIYFDATFVEIIRNTLTVSNYSDKDGECNGNLRSMPKDMIQNIEPLYTNIWVFCCLYE